VNEQNSSFFRAGWRKKLEQIRNFKQLKQQSVLDQKRRNERRLFNLAKANLIEASGLWKFRDPRMVLVPHEMQAFGSLTAVRERFLARFQGLRNASQLSTGRHQPWFGSLSISFPEYPDSCRKRTVPALTFSHPQRHETATGPRNGCGAKLPFRGKILQSGNK
jgi:hypothetical protein